MRSFSFLVVVVSVGLAAPARAETSDPPLRASGSAAGSDATRAAPPPRTRPADVRTGEPDTMAFAIASGSPIEWFMGTLRLSADVGLGRHVAVRTPT